MSRSPPLALQPSLGHYYATVNNEWRKGYMGQTSQSGHYLSDPLLSRVVVVSISGGYNDYQVLFFFATVLGIFFFNLNEISIHRFSVDGRSSCYLLL